MASRSNTSLVSHLDCPGGGQVWVDGTTLFIAHMSAPHGTTIVDVSDPASPKVVTSIPVHDGKSHTHKVRVAGDIMVTNVEMNKRHLLRRGSQKLADAQAKLSAALGRPPTDRELAAELKFKEGDIALIREFMAKGYHEGGFKVWDISNRAKPRLLHHERTFGFGVHRFGAVLEGVLRCGGFEIPRRVVAGWYPGTDRWVDGAFIRYTVDAATFR